MNKLVIISLIVIFAGCVKDKAVQPVPSEPPPVPPKITFVFVNRVGFRNDSTRVGTNDVLFQGPCLDTKYYDVSENLTHLDNTCYNRNFAENNFPVADSIFFRSYETSVGDKFAFKIEMRWWNYSIVAPYTKTAQKILFYTTKGWPNGDTLKSAQDTVIKFIWPNDTASGRYIKTYQWP